MYKKSTEGLSKFQLAGSFVGFLLPVLQFFFNFLPGTTNGIFLIGQHFFFVSIFAALVSFMLITIARNNIWFDIPISRKANKKYQEHLARTDNRVFELKDIQTYLKKNPYVKRPFSINPDNIFITLMPVAVTSFLAFFAIGLVEQANPNPNRYLVFAQAVFYVLVIAFTTLTLAIYYIRDVNDKKRTEKERVRVDSVVRLAYENNAFSELPHINLIAQIVQQQGFLQQHLFIFRVNDRFYKIVTDNDVDKIITVESYDKYEEMLHSLSSEEGVSS